MKDNRKIKILSVPLLFVLAGILSIANGQDTTVWENVNIGNYILTQPGVYFLKGKVTGNINFEHTSGNVEIYGEGMDVTTLQGIDRTGDTARHVSHIKGAIPANDTLLIHDLTIKGDGHNAIECAGDGYREIYNVHVVNYEREEDGKTYENVGSINFGNNSVIRDCYIETGDDAAKLTEMNSRCYDTRIRLTSNGAAIQLGWGDRFNGPNHIADNVEITGKLDPNLYESGALRKNEDGNPGRCIIGGIIQNDGNKLHLTNLDINVTDYKHLIKLVAQDGKTDNPVLDDVYIQGTITDSSVMNHVAEGYTFNAVVLAALDGAQMNNVIIDLGDKVADPTYHFIKGNVNAKFKKSDGSYLVYKNGFIYDENDLVAPGVPGTITEEQVTNESISISWGAATDETGIAGYEIYVDGDSLTTVKTNNTILDGLNCQKTYAIKIRAMDFGGNKSDFNDEVNITTSACLNITGRIEAEDYSAMSGISTETTSDDGGGLNVGFISNGDWTEYKVNVDVTKEYIVHFRVASKKDGVTIQVVSNGTIVGTVPVTNTGGWQNWVTVTDTFSLEAGLNVIRLNFSGGNTNLMNLNWFGGDETSSILHTRESLGNISIYPNPVKEVLYVNAWATRIELYNISGKKVYADIVKTFDGMTINVEKLPQGMYFIRIDDGNSVSTHRFIKN
ncbi:MAG: carbohydrate-binding protein [Bacteroidales bacterium]|nr:carbohydrate-binding protein [Bacteroidales bacterium]